MKVSLGSIEVTDEERRAIADDIQHLEKVPASGLAKNAQIKAWVTRRLEAMFEDLVDEYRADVALRERSRERESLTPSVMVYDYSTNAPTTPRAWGDQVAFHVVEDNWDPISGRGRVLEHGTIVAIEQGGFGQYKTLTLEPTDGNWNSQRHFGERHVVIDSADVHWPPRRV